MRVSQHLSAVAVKIAGPVLAFMALSLPLTLNGQVFSPESQNLPIANDEGGEFNFVRVAFDTFYSRGFGYGPWSIDFPDADRNFLRGVSRLTNIRVMSEPIVLRFDDQKIFDYPFLYMEERLTNILAGSHRHWQTLDKVLCSFMISKEMLEAYWDNFVLTCQNHNNPIEKHLNEICKKEICLSPIPSLSVHMANSNSIFGIPPYIDIKKEWNNNKN